MVSKSYAALALRRFFILGPNCSTWAREALRSGARLLSLVVACCQERQSGITSALLLLRSASSSAGLIACEEFSALVEDFIGD